MRRTFWYGLVASLAVVSSMSAEPIIIVGDHVLQPNMAGQSVDLYVTGGDTVRGVNVNVQVELGGPHVENLVIFDDAGPRPYLFDAPNNSGTSDVDGPYPDSMPQWECRGTTLGSAQGGIHAEGLLTTIFFDTTGMTSGGPWLLSLTNTINGTTDFAKVPAAITDGTLTIGDGGSDTPEPSSSGLLLAGTIVIVWRLCHRRSQDSSADSSSRNECPVSSSRTKH